MFINKRQYLFVNRPISQIPQCIGQVSHNASFRNRNVNKCAHLCYKTVHCGISGWYIGHLCNRALIDDIPSILLYNNNKWIMMYVYKIRPCNMYMVRTLLLFVEVLYWSICWYPSGLLLYSITYLPVKLPQGIWVSTPPELTGKTGPAGG